MVSFQWAAVQHIPLNRKWESSKGLDPWRSRASRFSSLCSLQIIFCISQLLLTFDLDLCVCESPLPLPYRPWRIMGHRSRQSKTTVILRPRWRWPDRVSAGQRYCVCVCVRVLSSQISVFLISLIFLRLPQGSTCWWNDATTPVSVKRSVKLNRTVTWLIETLDDLFIFKHLTVIGVK